MLEGRNLKGCFCDFVFVLGVDWGYKSAAVNGMQKGADRMGVGGWGLV